MPKRARRRSSDSDRRIYATNLLQQTTRMFLLQTERLLLREMTEADAEHLVRLGQNPNVTRYLPDRPLVQDRKVPGNFRNSERKESYLNCSKWTRLESVSSDVKLLSKRNIRWSNSPY